MRKMIEMNYGKGSSVLVAVDIPEAIEIQSQDGITKVNARDKFLDLFRGKAERIDKDFSDSLTEMVVKYSRPIVKSFQDLKQEGISPKKASAEFSLSFTGTGNVYLVEASMEGAIKVSLEWEL